MSLKSQVIKKSRKLPRWMRLLILWSILIVPALCFPFWFAVFYCLVSYAIIGYEMHEGRLGPDSLLAKTTFFGIAPLTMFLALILISFGLRPGWDF